MGRLELDLRTILLATACAFSGIVPAASRGATFNVTKTADTADGVCGADCSLREAIVAANAAGAGSHVINVLAGTYNLNPSGAVGTGELRVGAIPNASIAISGAGAASTIIHQSNTGFRVFNLDPNVVGSVGVSLSNLTISGGAAQSSGGGAIRGGGTGDSLNLTSVTITGNSTSGANSAAGIGWSPAGNVTISNCSFSSNISGSNAGSILFSSTGALNITNTAFAGNTAAAAGNAGGALFLGGGTTTITGCTFSGNQATNGTGIGGAIYLGGGTLTVNYNRFVGNSAGVATSGGIGVRGGTANAQENWWGCNAGPGAASCDRADNNGGTLDFTPWLILAHAANPNPVCVSATATLTASFLKDSSNNNVAASNLGALTGVPVTFASAVLGSISNAQPTIQSGGTATASFTAGGTSGAASAAATVDSATESAAITVSALTTTSSFGSEILCEGSTASFTTFASGGGPFTFVWKRNTTPISSGGNITITTGVSTSNLSITNVQTSDEAMYSAEVTGRCNTAAQSAPLTVKTPPMATVGSAQSIPYGGTTGPLGGNQPSQGSGTWSLVSSGTGSFSNAGDPAATFHHISGAGPFTLRWTVINSPCATSSADMTITVLSRTIAVWRSVRTHGAAGPQSITLNTTATGNGVAGPTVECREGGIQKIEVDFSGAATLANASAITVVGRTTSNGVLGGPVSYTPLSVSMSSATTMIITFAPSGPGSAFLPDQGCYTLTIPSSTLVEGLSGDTNILVRSLLADATGSGDVTISDAILTKARINSPLAVSARFDMNLLGSITAADAQLAKGNAILPRRRALCP